MSYVVRAVILAENETVRTLVATGPKPRGGTISPLDEFRVKFVEVRPVPSGKAKAETSGQP
jgi:hypothetical protein